MEFDGRVYVAGQLGLAAVLGSIVAFDVYEDAVVQGNALGSTLVENALPMALVVVMLGVSLRVARRYRDATFQATVTRWTLAGGLTVLGIGALVVTLQTIQGQIKPWIIVFQLSVVGAVAGLSAGFNTAKRDRTSKKVERERDRFRALFDVNPAGIVDVRLADGDLVVQSVNDSFLELFPMEMLSPGERTLAEVLPEPDEATLETIRERVATGETFTGESIKTTPDGLRHFRLKVAPYATRGPDDRKAAFVIYQDVTDLVRAREEVARTRRSNEQLEQFAYVASHDLQEPLRMVSSYLDILAEEYRGELDAEADEYIEYAVDGAERMQDMIDDLLAYSRVQTRGEEFTETDPNDVMDATETDFELLLDEHDAELSVGELPAVECDANQLGQLLRNLVKNAVEHGGEGEPPRVSVEATRQDGNVEFAVSDNGPGVPEDQRDRVFEIFEQGSAGANGGTGMGLAIARRIVDRHGGDIWIESAESGGASVRFTLPAAGAEQ